MPAHRLHPQTPLTWDDGIIFPMFIFPPLRPQYSLCPHYREWLQSSACRVSWANLSPRNEMKLHVGPGKRQRCRLVKRSNHPQGEKWGLKMKHSLLSSSTLPPFLQRDDWDRERQGDVQGHKSLARHGRDTPCKAVLAFCLFACSDLNSSFHWRRKENCALSYPRNPLAWWFSCKTGAASLYVPGLILGSTRFYKQSSC